MRHKSNKTSFCPVARSLDVVGEWWSLLIIRDAMLGVKRFSDFQRRLGMAKNILTTRLKQLVAAGVLRTTPASDGSAYLEYGLTEKGKALLPVLIALRQWGERFMFDPKEQRTKLVDKKMRKPLEKIEVRDASGRAVAFDDIALIDPKAAA